MNKGLISVIIPVYNGQEFIRDAIESVLSQSYKNFELIVVDDGSSDDSVSIIKDYLGKIVFIDGGRGGSPAIARNRGISHARGEYVTFLDQDDLWLPQKLGKQLQYMQNNPDVGFAHSSVTIVINNKTIYQNYYEEVSSVLTCGSTNNLFEKNFIANPTSVIVRKDLLLSVGMFDERLYGTDDYDLWLRLSLTAKLGFISDVLAVCRKHSTNASHDRIRMLLNEFKALVNFTNDYNIADNIISNDKINKRLFELATEIGQRFKEQYELNDALYWIIKSLQYKPYDPRIYMRISKYLLIVLLVISKRIISNAKN